MGFKFNPFLIGNLDDAGSSGAPTDASYVTLSTNATLTSERVLTGTANQVAVTDNGAGSTVVLSTPQNIHTGASPTFAGATLSGLTQGSVLFAGSGGLISQDNAELFYDDTDNQMEFGDGSHATAGQYAKVNIFGTQATGGQPGFAVKSSETPNAMRLYASQAGASLFEAVLAANLYTDIAGNWYNDQSNSNAGGVIIDFLTRADAYGLPSQYMFLVCPGSAAGGARQSTFIYTMQQSTTTGNSFWGPGAFESTLPTAAATVFRTNTTTKPAAAFRGPSSADCVQFWNSSSQAMAFVTNVGGFVFNELGSDADCRVEGDTDVNLLFTDASTDRVGIGTATPATKVEVEHTLTISGATADGYAGAVTLDPAYSAAAAQTVTRHNYLDVQNVDGGANVTITDAAVMRFDAAAGTHKAVDAGTAKATPGTVDAWLKANINGTIHFMPAYISKTT